MKGVFPGGIGERTSRRTTTRILWSVCLDAGNELKGMLARACLMECSDRDVGGGGEDNDRPLRERANCGGDGRYGEYQRREERLRRDARIQTLAL